MDLPHYLRIQAHANRLANHRLHRAMRGMTREDFHNTRTSFFPTLALTLNHILAVDQYYIGVLYREPNLIALHDSFVAADEVLELAARQAASDERLIACCDRLDGAGCDAIVEMPRRDHVQIDRTGHLLAHLFNHQTHHRGQAHAMLAGTAIVPPQLDEFMLPSEAHLRVGEMADLGWSEAQVYGRS